MSLLRSNAVRTVLAWQALATAVMAVVAGASWGFHAGCSAMLGGLVSIVSGAVFAALAGTRKGRSAGGVLGVALRAEAAKITAIVLLLWLVLANYGEVVALAFLVVFAVTAVIFSAAVAVRDE
ncbi:MAG: ATP synthase subunit I [Burkholderiales bacterium]|nr:ATP synthase subunit I [Burkholderiales bacterium]